MKRKTEAKTYPGRSGPQYIAVRSVERIVGRGTDEDEGPRYRVAFSSEEPVEREGFFGSWREVLGHDAGEVNLARFQSGRAAVLEEHRGPTRGVIETGEIDAAKKMGFADIRLSRTGRGKEIAADIDDKIIRNTSVGYIPKRARLVEENSEKGDLWRVTLWEPVEISVVGVPADMTVGFDRNKETDGAYPPVEVEDGSAVTEVRMKKKKVRDGGQIIEVDESDPREAVQEEERTAPVATATIDVGEERSQVRAAEKERITTLRNLGTMNSMPTSDVEKWIDDGLSVTEAVRKITQARTTKGAPQPAAETIDPMEALTAKDRAEYSYQRAIKLGAGMRAKEKGKRGDEWQTPFNGLEAEVHRYLEDQLPADAVTQGGILVPLDLRTREERLQAWWNKRTLDAKTLGKGTEVVFDQPGEMIELLRNQTMVLQSGARLLTGLSGPVTFVKQTGGLTVVWVGENPAADVAESDVSLTLVLMSPKTLMGTTGYTRQLLNQASIDIEALVRDELAIGHSLAIDRAAIHGLGSDGQPTGIYQAPGVSATAFGGASTFAKLIDQQTQVASANAAVGALGLLTTPGIAGLLRKSLEFPAVGFQPVWTGTFYNGIVGGYPARATNQVSSLMTGSEATGGTDHGGIFGNWNDLLIGLFSQLELVVDPYAKKKRGVIEVTSFQMTDIVLRHGESFSKATGQTV